ncbi:hypothetical protein A2U01_0067464, partial [Trifolium medium]|nr:hypothetical protein [Trifolium medium]
RCTGRRSSAAHHLGSAEKYGSAAVGHRAGAGGPALTGR